MSLRRSHVRCHSGILPIDTFCYDFRGKRAASGGRVGLQLNDPATHRNRHGLGAIGRAEFFHDGLHMSCEGVENYQEGVCGEQSRAAAHTRLPERCVTPADEPD
jgi:hypothetical protein